MTPCDNPLLVTIDTNLIDETGHALLLDAIDGLNVDVRQTTVSSREQETDTGASDLIETAVWGESVWGQSKWGALLPETLTIGESRIGFAVLGSDSDRFEEVLRIISNGSFPARTKRDSLTDGERRQLRDAMILETHTRERRDIFVSKDMRAYGRSGSRQREQLEQLCRTKIMSPSEFVAYCDELKGRTANP